MLQAWKAFCQGVAACNVGILPGLLIVALVIGGRFAGALQFLELRLLDAFLAGPNPEEPDERIVLIAIDEDTIQSVGTFPLPDQVLADVILELQQHHPRVIGLDLFRDLPVEPGHEALREVFQSTKNVIGAEKALPPPVDPPPDLPPEQVGITDALLDPDGRQRSMILGTQTAEGFKFALSLRVAELYLQSEGFSLENGIVDQTAMRFGEVEFPRFRANFGSYVQGNTGEGAVQILLNFRRGAQPFRFITVNHLLTGNYDPAWIEDRMVLIGIATPSVPDNFSVAASSVFDQEASWVYGLEVQAHAVSQLTSAVLDGRPLIRVWSDGVEYAWILFWGVGGILLAVLSRSPSQTMLWFPMVALGLLVGSYLLFLWGWWIPVLPAIAAFGLNSLTLATVYEHDRRLAAVLEAKQERILILQQANERLEGRVAERTAELQQVNQKLERLVHLDGLTEVANRRHFDEYLSRIWSELMGETAALSLILADIDCFKRYNDYYGHLQGDACLIKVAQAMAATLPQSEYLAARYGGEEFAVILPTTDLATATDIAEAIQRRITDLEIPHQNSEVSTYVTLSMGVATCQPRRDLRPDDLIAAADAALYQAKSSGRNQVVSWKV